MVGFIVLGMAGQNIFAVLQDAEFWPTFQAKSVHVDTTAPILVPVRHANPLIGSTEGIIDGLDHVVRLIWLCMAGQNIFAVLARC